jgi:zinc transport system substrate-binding protein
MTGIARGFACAGAALCVLVADAAADGAVSVFVSVPPQAWVVRRVGGDTVTVGVMVPKGQEMHTFEVTPQLVQRLSGVSVYFLGGFPFETTLTGKVSGVSGMRFADMTAGIARRTMDEKHEGGECAHGEEGLDPHVWMSTACLSAMASNTAAALGSMDPAGAERYRANRDAAVAELCALRAELAARLAPLKGARLYVYHPAFGYFADEFGLQQVAVELAGKEPTPRHLSRLVEQGRREGIRLIVVQPQFSRRSADVVARALGAAVAAVDPMAEDVPATLRRLADAVAAPRPKEVP